MFSNHRREIFKVNPVLEDSTLTVILILLPDHEQNASYYQRFVCRGPSGQREYHILQYSARYFLPMGTSQHWWCKTEAMLKMLERFKPDVEREQSCDVLCEQKVKVHGICVCSSCIGLVGSNPSLSSTCL